MSSYAVFMLFCFLLALMIEPNNLKDSVIVIILAGAITAINWLFM